jgi:antitoxin (DNA-binding transcriptional repressor) of toxin-antitoxin stability system
MEFPSRIPGRCVIHPAMSMTTLTPNRARSELPRLLRRALKGDDIGIVVDGRIVALRPVAVESMDYAEREYGLSAGEMETIETKLHGQIQKARKACKLREFSGDIEALVARPRRRRTA